MAESSREYGILPQRQALNGPSALEQVIHDLIMNLVGLAGDLVRPAYQAYPAKAPKPSVDWCAFWLHPDDSQNWAETVHYSDEDGYDIVTDYVKYECLISFYGPNSFDNALVLRRGLSLEQNSRETLRPIGAGIRSIGMATRLPELIQEYWLQRTDLPVKIVHAEKSKYKVMNLLHAQGTIKDSVIDTNFDTKNARKGECDI